MGEQRVIRAVGEAGSSDDGKVTGFDAVDGNHDKWRFVLDTISVPVFISTLEAAYHSALEKMPQNDPTKPKHLKARKVTELRVDLDPLRNEPSLTVLAEPRLELHFGLTRELAAQLRDQLDMVAQSTQSQSPRQN